MKTLIQIVAVAVVAMLLGAAIFGIASGLDAITTSKREKLEVRVDQLERDVKRHETLIEQGRKYDCAWILFEDYSVAFQASDRKRFACAKS